MKKKSSRSLRFVVPTVFILLIALVASVLIVFSMELGNQVKVQTEQNMRSVLRAVSINITEEMNQLEEYLDDVATDYILFKNLGSEQDMTQVYYAAEEIGKTFEPIISRNNSVTGILVYSANAGIFHGAYGQLAGETGAERVQLKTSIRQALPQGLENGEIPMNEWTTIVINGRYFLCRAVNWREVYCVCLLDIEYLAEIMEQKYSIDGRLLFAKNEQLLTNDDAVSEVSHLYKDDSTIVIEDYVGSIGIVCVVPYAGISQLTLLQTMLLVISALAIITLPLLYRYLNGSFLRPMKKLVYSMERIQAGDLQERVSDKYSSVEFKRVSDTFNSMIGQIGELKIETYEKQLAAERSEMIALKMQIKPHFFLNCLKNLYALAGAGNTVEVQSLILPLSKHLRYVLSFHADTVDLETELELCRNYVELHSIGRVVPSVCWVNVDKRLAELKVPVVSVLTLVENSVKHATLEKAFLQIWLEARCLDMDGEMLANITIRDNGSGFTEEQLHKLNLELPRVQESGEHIGIANVIRRFTILYGENFAATFSNGSDGGAQIDLYIPQQKEEVIRSEAIDS
ncbi:MAG: sensor histidine kinase [Oscillospiraceae bacterium]